MSTMPREIRWLKLAGIDHGAYSSAYNNLLCLCIFQQAFNHHVLYETQDRSILYLSVLFVRFTSVHFQMHFLRDLSQLTI